MRTSDVYKWIEKDQVRKEILSALEQPLTAAALSKNSNLRESYVSYILTKMTKYNLTICLNNQMRNSRVYGLTEFGKALRKTICGKDNYYQPEIDWNIYGKVCFNHRRNVIKVISEPMQPAEIKRTLRIRKPDIKISANNIRDTIRQLLKLGIVRPVKIRKKAHLRYELTGLGKELKELL